MTAATGDSLSFGYDALKRLNRVTAKSGSSVILNTAYAYRDVSWNRGSAQVEFRNVRLGSDSGMLLEGKKYVYDDVGNLKEIRGILQVWRGKSLSHLLLHLRHSRKPADRLPERGRYHDAAPDLHLRRRAVARSPDGRQWAGDPLRCLGQPAVLRRLELRLAERKTAENGVENL